MKRISALARNKFGEQTKGALLTLLSTLFRRGDVVCPWDSRWCLVQLTGIEQKAVSVVKRRLERALKGLPFVPPTLTVRVVEPSAEPASLENLLS
ncbi:MAG: hypothetical protein QME79_10330 [Bacillota bacterium]|nr:hypothetical protein [Bacillota bacterium]